MQQVFNDIYKKTTYQYKLNSKHRITFAQIVTH